MHRTLIIFLTTILLLVATSCTNKGGDSITATMPTTDPEAIPASETIYGLSGSETQTQLWGIYDISLDVETQTLEVVFNRQAMYAVNLMSLLNQNHANVRIHLNGLDIGADYIDVDADVYITHPIPDNSAYNIYDVRGVIIGNGSKLMNYSTASLLRYPVLGTDLFMMADPNDPDNVPDGYTRWFNKAEFSLGGIPLMQYTPAYFADDSFDCDSSLNAYKYFADGLGVAENIWDWLKYHNEQQDSQRGVFSSGSTNGRNYQLRFPLTDGLHFGFAVLANWEGEQPIFHPSNAPEAVACSVVDNSEVYFLDNPGEGDKYGGDLSLDISLFCWDQPPSSICIVSTVLYAAYQMSGYEMIPTKVVGNQYTYHVEIPLDWRWSSHDSVEENEFWVIAQCDGFDYSNEFNSYNLAGEDPLTAYFRHDLNVSDELPQTDATLNFAKSQASPVGDIAGHGYRLLSVWDAIVTGEPIKLSKFIVRGNLADEGGNTTLTFADLTNGYLIDMNTGGILAGLINATDGLGTVGTTAIDPQWIFTNTFVLEPGTTQIGLKTKLSPDWETGDTIVTTLYQAADFTARSVSNNAVIVPTGLKADANLLTFKGGRMAVRTLGVPATGNVIVGATDFVWSTFSFDADDSGEDIFITAVTITDTLDGTYADMANIDNAELWADLDQNGTYETKITATENPTGGGGASETHYFVFNQAITVSRDESIEWIFMGDLSFDATPGGTHALTVAADGATCIGADSGLSITDAASGSAGTQTVVP